MESTLTYLIRRFCFNENHPEHRQVIETDLTLEEAQAHCKDEATRGMYEDGSLWFDGYEAE